NKFNKKILESIRNFSPNVREVKYIVGNNVSSLPKREAMIELPEKVDDKDEDINQSTNLNQKYEFETFIVGSNNELAYAAAQAVSKNLGKTYNPLFIYGGVGLGKTHLLQSIGNKIYAGDQTKKIKYIPSERLTAEIVGAIGDKTIENLKKKYAELDLLIIDDIQFLAGKEKTQDIFFATFNELYSQDKQIVLSSDRPPKAIPALAERLRSRFEGGMIADIGMPDFETRLAIMKFKAKEKGLDFPEEVLNFIASNIQKNIRELEGALNRITAVAQIYNRIPELKEVKKLLNTYLSSPYRKTTPQIIIKTVADFYSIPITDLVKRSRKKEIVRPRQICMYLLREEARSSFPEIGQKLGGRDHSTVIHAYEKIHKEEQEQETVKQELTLIRERIYQGFDNK
ncbi:MAG: chromosomal replication initiator protein DnaA, partial [Nitrososphaeraceae archaeon]|nr:chromosomal replication initiator protein DnaA [Nitrososphaeraceae archaeon]